MNDAVATTQTITRRGSAADWVADNLLFLATFTATFLLTTAYGPDLAGAAVSATLGEGVAQSWGLIPADCSTAIGS